MLEHLPEQVLGQRGVASLVGVGQTIATGRTGPADGRQRPRMQLQAVADIIKPDGMSELRVKQRHDMAPRTEGARLFIDAVFAGQLGNQMLGNEIAKLAEQGEFGTGWLRARFVFHPCRVAGNLASANLFSSGCGMAVKLKGRSKLQVPSSLVKFPSRSELLFGT